MEISQEHIQYFIDETLKMSEYDFRGYSIKSFTRRLEKIVADNRMSIPEIVKKMSKNKDFLEDIVKSITVNTTELFRTPSIWQSLAPYIQRKFRHLDDIKIWHAACSTGQEMYSMMMLLSEMGLLDKTQIYGTDLNEDVLKVAKNGKYKLHDYEDHKINFSESMAQFPDFKCKDYFSINTKRGFIKMNKKLTEKPILRKHDLVKNENIFNVKFDLIMCRNVLIYFEHEVQNKIIKFFYENMSPKGILVIGKHESILSSIKNKFTKDGSIYILKPKLPTYNF